MENIELKEIELAAKRLQSILHHTEMDLSTTFSNMTGAEIYLKCENRQKTGSFKLRGAGNKIAKMVEEGDKSPVIASSAGNHAQGVAYAANKCGIVATICMPETAPIAKIQATEGYGAKVVLAGSCYDDTYTKALEICKETGAKFLHPYDDPDVIAGQGSLGLEVLSDLPTVDVVIAPAGGGGLLAGVACAIKQVNPRIQVIGVQAEGADAICQSFEQKKRICTEKATTIADGIAVKAPGELTIKLINKYVDNMVRVSDSEIANAILLLMERCKMIVEPAGATPVAAVLSDKLDLKGKKVICILSGGNIDVSLINNLIEQGLVARHRRIQFSVRLVDAPGNLATLLTIIAKSGANVLSVEHDRLRVGLKPNEAIVNVACEVKGQEHSAKLIEEIRNSCGAVSMEE